MPFATHILVPTDFLGRLQARHLCRGDARKASVTKATVVHVHDIVIATHGRTGLKHVLIGSIAERVVRHAGVPVLSLRSSATD